MLSGLAAVHPAPRRALKRVVKGRDRGDDGDGDGDGLRDASAVDGAHAAAEAKSAGAKRGADEDDSEDSDYSDCSEDAALGSNEEGDEEEDRVEHRLALLAELDECSSEGRQDFYLERMLAERERLEGDDAAWVDRYVELQQQWKDGHAYSIDDFDLDVRLRARLQSALSRSSAERVAAAPATGKKRKPTARSQNRRATKAKPAKKRRREYSRVARALWRFWYLRVAPKLPLELQEERAEYVVALFALLAFVALSLAIQVFAALREL